MSWPFGPEGGCVEHLCRFYRADGTGKLSLVSSCLAAALWAVPALAETGEAGTAAQADDTPAEVRLVDINEYVVRGNTVLDAREIEAAVYPFLGLRRSLADIESARDALQERYQERGYQSVFIELPEQQVAGGVVFLQVVETRVGRVRVVGAKHYSPVAILDDVPALEEGSVPDFARVQEELGRVNRNPGRQVLPLVREGQRPGTMDIDLQVEDEKPGSSILG
ncbi:OMP85 family outer membrane protein [Pseudomonas sp. BAY1663]|nr:OMP85 family outer membrane protein [Pseudomonas sp. BAY1663]